MLEAMTASHLQPLNGQRFSHCHEPPAKYVKVNYQQFVLCGKFIEYLFAVLLSISANLVGLEFDHKLIFTISQSIWSHGASGCQISRQLGNVQPSY